MRKRDFPLRLFFLLIACGAVQAQGQPPFPEPEIRAVALLVVQPVQGERDHSFQSVLFSALRIELERAGLEVRPHLEDSLASPAGSALPSLLEAARGAGADFLFREGYILEGQELRLDIAVYGAEEGERIASVKTVGRIGLRLDEALARAAQALLVQLEQRIASAQERRRNALAGQRPAEAAPAEPARAREYPAGEERTPAPREPEKPISPPIVVREPVERAGPRRPPTWQAEAGAASFIPMLALSEVFPLGLEGLFTLERLWNCLLYTSPSPRDS